MRYAKPYHNSVSLRISPNTALLIMVLMLNWVIAQLAANPSGEFVTNGAATFVRTATDLTVTQSTNRAIIEWGDFSIANGQTTNFIQPDASSAVLNRVTGLSASTINGVLSANGQVYLINPNGIMVGSTGIINAGGFVGSTLDVSDAEFMAASDMNFAGTSTALIQIDGQINAIGGDVVLMARQVINNGTISSTGNTALAGGTEILLKAAGDERVFVQVGSLDGSVSNTGIINAANAELKAAGGNIFAFAVNNTGVIRATGVADKDGQVWLTGTGGTVINDGSITATRGDTGGIVHILGDYVNILENTIIDVSGTSGGGTVLIGGDYQGNNPEIPNALSTTVASGAVIKANATDTGDGGRVIFWADETTDFAGTVYAGGGPNGGDGGFVEVSAKTDFSFTGVVDVLADMGEAGTLLLDPDTINIVSGGGGSLPGAPTGNNDIDPATIFAALAGGNVIIQANIAITITDDIIGANATNNNLSFIANAGAGTVTMNASKIDIGGGDLQFDSPLLINTDNVELVANKITTVGSVTKGMGVSNLTLTADDMDIQSTVTYTDGRVTLQERTAGTMIDLGTHTDLAASTLELSNNEIKNIVADTLVIGSTDAGNMVISQRISPDNINTLHLMTGGTIDKGTPSTEAFDLSTWSTRGIAGANDGIWTVGGGGTFVTQDVNAQTPTFFMSNDTSGYINAVFEGTFEVNAATTDNDYIGFVFGAQEPTALGDNKFDFKLFDWVQGNFASNNKFMLSDVNDANNTGNHSANNLWTRTDNASVDMLQVNSNTPWTAGVAYDIRLTYTKTNVTAEIKGGAFGAAYTEVINFDAADPVNNPNVAGDFGFYNFSQDNSRYSNFTLTELPSLEMNGKNLAVTAGGSVTLTENVDVNNVAINAGGDIKFTDSTGFNIASVDGVSGFNANGNGIELESSANVTQTAGMIGTGLELKGTNANYTLENSSNDLSTVAANVNSLKLRDDNGFSIGTVGTTNGITSANGLTLTSSGTVTQTQTINADELELLGTNGNFQLTNNGNRVNTLAADTGSVAYHENDNYMAGTVSSGTSGITTTGNTTLSTTGTVTQSGAINTAGLELLGTGGTYTLTNSANTISTIAGNTADVSVLSDTSLTVGTVNTVGLSTTGNISLQTSGTSSDIILDQSIAADTDSNAAATDSTVVLASSADFHNNAGAAAIDPGNGRYLVYSTSPNNNTQGGLTASRQYGQTFAANPPASITPATDNKFLFSITPTLTVSANDLSKTYGSANPGLSFSYLGLMNGDSITDIIGGTPVLSTAVGTGTDAGSYLISIANGTLTAPALGYNLALDNGVFTVNKANLTITADDFTRNFGESNPGFTGSFSGFVNGDSLADIDSFSFNTSAGIGSVAGTYDINPFAFDNNYNFFLNPGILTVLADNDNSTPDKEDDIIINGDFILTTVKNQPTLIRLTGGTGQGGLVVREFETVRPEALWPPREFPARFSERGQNLVTTPSPYFEDPYIEVEENDYDITDQSFVHENFRVIYRQKAGQFGILFEGDNAYNMAVLTKSSFHEFLDQERPISGMAGVPGRFE